MAGAVVVFIAAVIGGWWFLVRETAELATEPREIPRELVDGTDGTSSSDTLTFQIIPEESEAAYFVDEELARLGLPSTAKGTTNAIEGQLVLTADGTALAPGAESMFTIGLTTLTSDQARRDRSVQQALETSVFPVATFTIEGATGFDPSINEGAQQDILLTGTLDLHGVQREVTWEVEAIREANVISALATVTFSFADFGIVPPNIAGIVSVADEATLQVQLIAQLI
ncbi:MAG: YceI family protein [Chloroflexi bacterium]|nr:YceI family protein [Chloroflexota bacterium]